MCIGYMFKVCLEEQINLGSMETSFSWILSWRLGLIFSCVFCDCDGVGVKVRVGDGALVESFASNMSKDLHIRIPHDLQNSGEKVRYIKNISSLWR